MSRVRRKRLNDQRLKAHDWERHEYTHVDAIDGQEVKASAFTTVDWKCRKCGVVMPLRNRKPNLYARFEVRKTSSSGQLVSDTLLFVPHGPGMFCHEVTAWKVMET